MSEQEHMKIELSPSVIRLLCAVLRRSDPLGVYAAAVVADIERQVIEQSKQEPAKP